MTAARPRSPVLAPLPRLSGNQRRAFLGAWLLVAVTLAIWARLGGAGWDFAIYRVGLHSLLAGHDPYADAMAAQRLFHQQMAAHPELVPYSDPPYSYVYSPITLPALRVLGGLPGWLVGGSYLLLYLAAIAGQGWAGIQALEGNERRWLIYLAPLAAFFPGLIANASMLSGNIAFILYGLVLVSAVAAWRGASWRWFYLAVLAASCVKAPLLSLVVIPVFSARRQWVPTALTAAAGIGLFAIQPRLWPSLFQHYLEAVELQFSYNRDFGSSPAGLFSGWLWDHGLPYSPGGLLFYLAYAIPVFGLLLLLSRRFFAGQFSFGRWIPVLLVGVLLLNPRLIEYDLVPIAVPMFLIAWRALTSAMTVQRGAMVAGGVFLVINAVGLSSWLHWKMTEGPLLVVIFATGCWSLLRESTEAGKPLHLGLEAVAAD